MRPAQSYPRTEFAQMGLIPLALTSDKKALRMVLLNVSR
jgi:hypothetical protein